jgi:hypothetical protein
MAIALVGVGTLGVGGAGAAFTPSWGALTRVAGDLLVGWAASTPGAGSLIPPTGWTIGVFQNTTVGSVTIASTIVYKIATGGDVAPTFSAVAGNTWTVLLGEFSGTSRTNVADHAGGTTIITASPITSSASGIDSNVGELILSINNMHGTTLITRTLTNSFNNGASNNNVANNNTASVDNHYSFDWGITTTQPLNTLDADSCTYTGTINIVTQAFISFKIPFRQRTMTGVGI